jgi:hypothetical protein
MAVTMLEMKPRNVSRPEASSLRPVRWWAIGFVFVLPVLLATCAPAADEQSESQAERDVQPPAAGVVDSILPVEEELRRFREGLPEMTTLAGGTHTRDELVERFLDVLERNQLEALAPILLTRSEFGWLYYPHTMYTKEPYRLSPELLWFQVQNTTASGLQRLRSELAGRPLHATGHRCEDEPTVEGPNRIWKDCVVTLDPPNRDPIQLRLFGSILERFGVFKFVSFAADM